MSIERVLKKPTPQCMLSAFGTTSIEFELWFWIRDPAAGVANVEPVLATQAQTKLPDASVDLAIMVDVYHEATRPEVLLQGLRKALKPGGRLVLVEFRGEDPEVPILPEHKMTLKQVRREVEPQGFDFVDSLEFLPWQHVILFRKPAGEEAKPAP